jgi:hypothetical protein
MLSAAAGNLTLRSTCSRLAENALYKSRRLLSTPRRPMKAVAKIGKKQMSATRITWLSMPNPTQMRIIGAIDTFGMACNDRISGKKARSKGRHSARIAAVKIAMPQPSA